MISVLQGLDGSLVGWWVGRLVVWLVGCLAGWLVDWLVGWLVGWLTGWLVNRLLSWPVGNCTRSLVVINQHSHWHHFVFYVQGVSVNHCHFQLNSALVIANLFIWKQCQSNKQGLEFHIWVALWMACSMWAPWDSRTAWRRNTKFCTTRVSIPLVTCAQFSLILSFSSGKVWGSLLNTLSFR